MGSPPETTSPSRKPCDERMCETISSGSTRACGSPSARNPCEWHIGQRRLQPWRHATAATSPSHSMREERKKSATGGNI